MKKKCPAYVCLPCMEAKIKFAAKLQGRWLFKIRHVQCDLENLRRVRFSIKVYYVILTLIDKLS